MMVDALKQNHYAGNDDDRDPGAFAKLRDDNDDQRDSGGHRAHTIDD